MLSRLRTIRAKLVAVILLIIAIQLVSVGVITLADRRLHRFFHQSFEQSEIEHTIEAYAYALQDISTGVFMSAADQDGVGESVILEAEFLLTRLEEQLAQADLRSVGMDYATLGPLIDIRAELDAHARATVALIDTQRRLFSAHGQPIPEREQAARHLALAKASMLAEHASLYMAQTVEQLRQSSHRRLLDGARLATLTATITVLSSGLAVLAGFLVSVLFARWLVQRLGRLEEAARSVGRGNLSARVQVDGNDELGRLAGSFNSMADAVEASIAVRLSKEYVENILRTMTSGLVVLVKGDDGQQRIERVNRALCQLLGYTEDELLGRDVSVLLRRPEAQPPQPDAQELAHRSDAVQPAGLAEPGNLLCPKGVSRVETRLFTRDGHEIPAAASSAPMPDSPRLVLVLDDVSERHALIGQLLLAKQAAENATQAKTAFLATMSHELRTPLNGILGYVQILQLDRSLTDRHREALETMRQSGEHLLTLLNDLLDISKIEAQRMELSETEFHLPRFLEGIVAMIRVRAEDKKLQFLYEELSELPVAVRGDQKRLRQVLINLLGNAVKFTDQGGVVFKVGLHYGRVRFQVEDTGMGMAPEHQVEIFKPFRQVGAARASSEGTGLGLAISKRLVEMMGGTLHVRSELGKGSAFWVDLELPVVSSFREDTTSGRQVLGYLGTRRKLLVVDDKADNRAVLAGMLAPLGFELREADNGQAALEEAASWRPDAILMDLRMPTLDGLEATRRLRATPELAHMVVIAVSASAFDENRSESMAAGCNGFITKPLRLDLLVRELGRCLALTWIYEESAHPGKGNDEPLSKAPLVPPPAAEAEALYEMALRGDIKSIRTRIATVEALGVQYQPFAAELHALAKRYRIKEIRELLRPYVPASRIEDTADT